MAVGREKHMQKHMDKRKVTIIGAGHVGSHVALALVYEGVADEIVLVDKVEGKADAQALDASDAVSYMNHEVVVRGGDYSDVEDSQVVVCAIGMARKPGQTRIDLAQINLNIMKSINRFARHGNNNVKFNKLNLYTLFF